MPITKLDKFKAAYKKRLAASTQHRISHSNVAMHFRRLDSLARLLEGNSVCAAVYYHTPTKTLWLANNKVHGNSHAENHQIKNMKAVFDLVSNENLSLEKIIEHLTQVICLNIQQEHRFAIMELQRNEPSLDLKKTVQDWLEDMFKANTETKKWQDSAINDLEYEGNTQKILTKFIEKTSRLTRDFLKLRDTLLDTHNYDPLAKEILSAIRQKRFHIVHHESKSVHAEMRVLSKKLGTQNDPNPYIAISKLCCGHCATAMDAFAIPTRGAHGQGGTAWPIPGFMLKNSQQLQQYLGDEAYAAYQALSANNKKVALKYIASKDSNTNTKTNRRMSADTSDSDIEFGLELDDDDQQSEVSVFPLADVWQLRHIKFCYTEEFDRLTDIGLSVQAILTLYKKPGTKFNDLASKSVMTLINQLEEEGYPLELFERLENIYDEDKSLFWSIVNDENESAIKYGLDEVCDRYKAKIRQYRYQRKHGYCSDGEEFDPYGEAANELDEENNGWDYDYNSDDSANPWIYKNSDADTDYSSDEEQNSYSSNNSDTDSGYNSDTLETCFHKLRF